MSLFSPRVRARQSGCRVVHRRVHLVGAGVAPEGTGRVVAVAAVDEAGVGQARGVPGRRLQGVGELPS